MDGAHFKEILHTVCITRNLSVTRVAFFMKLTRECLNQYCRNGVPVSKKPMVIAKLRTILFDL